MLRWLKPPHSHIHNNWDMTSVSSVVATQYSCLHLQCSSLYFTCAAATQCIFFTLFLTFSLTALIVYGAGSPAKVVLVHSITVDEACSLQRTAATVLMRVLLFHRHVQPLTRGWEGPELGLKKSDSIQAGNLKKGKGVRVILLLLPSVSLCALIAFLNTKKLLLVAALNQQAVKPWHSNLDWQHPLIASDSFYS